MNRSNIFMSKMVKNSALVNEVCDKFSDWRRLPAELKPKVKRKIKSKVKPSIKVKPRVKVSAEDVAKTLEVS